MARGPDRAVPVPAQNKENLVSDSLLAYGWLELYGIAVASPDIGLNISHHTLPKMRSNNSLNRSGDSSSFMLIVSDNVEGYMLAPGYPGVRRSPFAGNHC
jgi:hypothetical protein